MDEDLSQERREIGDADRVVALVDVDVIDWVVVLKGSQDPEVEAVDACMDVGRGAEQARHVLLFTGEMLLLLLSLPFRHLRSPSSHSTTLSNESSNSVCLRVSLGLSTRERPSGKSAPRILVRTSLNGMVRESSNLMGEDEDTRRGLGMEMVDLEC